MAMALSSTAVSVHPVPRTPYGKWYRRAVYPLWGAVRRECAFHHHSASPSGRCRLCDPNLCPSDSENSVGRLLQRTGRCVGAGGPATVGAQMARLLDLVGHRKWQAGRICRVEAAGSHPHDLHTSVLCSDRSRQRLARPHRGDCRGASACDTVYRRQHHRSPFLCTPRVSSRRSPGGSLPGPKVDKLPHGEVHRDPERVGCGKRALWVPSISWVLVSRCWSSVNFLTPETVVPFCRVLAATPPTLSSQPHARVPVAAL